MCSMPPCLRLGFSGLQHNPKAGLFISVLCNPPSRDACHHHLVVGPGFGRLTNVRLSDLPSSVSWHRFSTLPSGYRPVKLRKCNKSTVGRAHKLQSGLLVSQVHNAGVHHGQNHLQLSTRAFGIDSIAKGILQGCQPASAAANAAAKPTVMPRGDQSQHALSCTCVCVSPPGVEPPASCCGSAPGANIIHSQALPT